MVTVLGGCEAFGLHDSVYFNLFDEYEEQGVHTPEGFLRYLGISPRRHAMILRNWDARVAMGL